MYILQLTFKVMVNRNLEHFKNSFFNFFIWKARSLCAIIDCLFSYQVYTYMKDLFDLSNSARQTSYNDRTTKSVLDT